MILYEMLNNEMTVSLFQNPTPFSKWQNILSNKHLETYRILKEMLENGFCVEKNHHLQMSVSDFYSFWADNDELDGMCSTLYIPTLYGESIYISMIGDIHENESKLIPTFCKQVVGSVPTEPTLLVQDGIFLLDKESRRRLFTLTEQQYRTLNAIAAFNHRDKQNQNRLQNLKDLAKLQGFVNKDISGKITLDSLLFNQEIIEPQKVKIDLIENEEDGSLEVIPKIEYENASMSDESLKRHSEHINQEFLNSFDNLNKVNKDYSLNNEDGQGRIRIIPTENQLKGLKVIKEKVRKIYDPDAIKQMKQNPHIPFEDQGIDFDEFDPSLDEYWDRVIGIGIYEPKYQSFVSKETNEWLPGFIGENGIGKKVYLDTLAKVEEFHSLINSAKSENKNTVHYADEELPIKDAELIVEHARKQLENPSIPVTETSNSSKMVLIIADNIDELNFSIENQGGQGKLEHTFEEIPHLNVGIELKKHQKEGVAWLQSLKNMNMGGALLADDMGLGKTLQILSFMEWIAFKGEKKPFLIVAPVSLLENWEKEYSRFFDHSCCRLQPFNLHGKLGLKQNSDLSWLEEPREKPILAIINYHSLKQYEMSLGKIHWAAVALDEAQHIKTPGTLVTRASRALNSDFRIALTGTPVENSYKDLWCIMDFCIPGLLGSLYSFQKKYGGKDIDKLEELGQSLREEVGLYLKRRMKTDVASELPKKYISTDPDHAFQFTTRFKKSNFQRNMPSVQLEEYLNILNLPATGQKGDMLKRLQKVRAVCEHPYLDDLDHIMGHPGRVIKESARLLVLEDILKFIKKRDEKVIIFAERRHSQHMLCNVLEKHFSLSNVSIINGSTPARAVGYKESRQSLVDRFNVSSGFNGIVMSPIAAGTGLNVVGANHVIHYSRHWNPAKEEQATDRAYRIGQKKDVYVYYPMAVTEKFDTFDVILDRLLSNKRRLSEATLYPSEQVEIKTKDLFGSLYEKSS